MDVAIINRIISKKCKSNSSHSYPRDNEVKSYNFGVWLLTISEMVGTEPTPYYFISIGSICEIVTSAVDDLLDVSYIDLGTKFVLRVKYTNDKIYRFYEDCSNCERLGAYEIQSYI